MNDGSVLARRLEQGNVQFGWRVCVGELGGRGVELVDVVVNTENI